MVSGQVCKMLCVNSFGSRLPHPQNQIFPGGEKPKNQLETCQSHYGNENW